MWQTAIHSRVSNPLVCLVFFFAAPQWAVDFTFPLDIFWRQRRRWRPQPAQQQIPTDWEGRNGKIVFILRLMVILCFALSLPIFDNDNVGHRLRHTHSTHRIRYIRQNVFAKIVRVWFLFIFYYMLDARSSMWKQSNRSQKLRRFIAWQNRKPKPLSQLQPPLCSFSFSLSIYLVAVPCYVEI